MPARPITAGMPSVREARAVATILAVVLWSAAVFVFASGSGPRSATGRLKGADFLQFYTSASVAARGETRLLYDPARLHARQVELVPESGRELYLPVYPPQTSLLYLPLSRLPYGWALAAWTLSTVLLYACTVRRAWTGVRHVLPDGRLVALAAASFPPFWSLVLHGQNTAIPLVLFLVGAYAHAAGRPFLAGLLLGGLAIKPQLTLVVGAVAILVRDWRLLAGAATSGLAQLALVAALLDLSLLPEYVRFMGGLAASEHLIEPKLHEMHSIRAVTRLVPGPGGTLLWIAASALVIEATRRVWISAAPALAKWGVLLLATVLVSPHLFVYDATVLAPALLWTGAWITGDPASAPAAINRYWTLVVCLYVLLLLPLALLVAVQPSVLVMVALLVLLTRHARAAIPATARLGSGAAARA